MKELVHRIVEYHKSLGFDGFERNIEKKPEEDLERFVRWYMKYSNRGNWIMDAIKAENIEELDMKLTLNGF